MRDINIKRMALGMYQTNCYIIYREGAEDTIIVDPADSGEFIFDKLIQNGLKPVAILLTHGHFDHIYGVNALKKKAECKVYAFEKEAELLNDIELNCSRSVGRGVCVEPDICLKDNEEVTVGNMTFSVLHTPGHTAGSACYYFKEAGFLIAGDTLFEGSVGRSDLPTGNGNTLIESICERLMKLPDNTKVYPGHGGPTTIESERLYNPFL